MSFSAAEAGGRYRAWMNPQKLAAILVSCGTFVLAGCGSDSPAASNATAAPSTSPAITTVIATDAASTTLAAGATTTSGAPTGPRDCGGNVVNKVAENETGHDVTKLEIIGGCSMLNISTSLADDGVAAALDICDRAAEVGYSSGVSSISVVSSSNRELAIGVKGSPCIGEP